MLHLTKKDFKLEWYSGSGAGGQHRNKHQNCCRITHLSTGFVERGTASKSRIENQKIAFTKLAHRVITFLLYTEKVPINHEVIRNYNEVRDEVHDKKSGFKSPYSQVVKKGNIGEMMLKRREMC